MPDTTPAAAPVSMHLPIIPKEQWRPATPAIRSGVGMRSAALYVSVIRQWGVEHDPRYQPPGDGRTWCNIFATDCTGAMDALIPHSIDLDGKPCPIGHGSELRANGTVDWLARYGPEFGWFECDAGRARSNANAGSPTVVCWQNPLPGHSGHIAMVLPDSPDVAGPRIAQAGAHCYFDVPLTYGFGQLVPPALRFYLHA